MRSGAALLIVAMSCSNAYLQRIPTVPRAERLEYAQRLQEYKQLQDPALEVHAMGGDAEILVFMTRRCGDGALMTSMINDGRSIPTWRGRGFLRVECRGGTKLEVMDLTR